MRQCWAAEGAGKFCLKVNSSSVKTHDFGLSVCRRCTTTNMGCSCCKDKASIVWLTNGNILRLCIHPVAAEGMWTDCCSVGIRIARLLHKMCHDDLSVLFVYATVGHSLFMNHSLVYVCIPPHPSTETMHTHFVGGCQVCLVAHRMKCWHCRYPVQAGDAIWMAPYVVQWYAALGQKSSRYILYKDTTLDPLIAT